MGQTLQQYLYCPVSPEAVGLTLQQYLYCPISQERWVRHCNNIHIVLSVQERWVRHCNDLYIATKNNKDILGTSLLVLAVAVYCPFSLGAMGPTL